MQIQPQHFSFPGAQQGYETEVNSTKQSYSKRTRCISSCRKNTSSPLARAAFLVPALHTIPSPAVQRQHRACFKQQMSLTNILREEHDKEGSDQVVDSLHVAAGWVSDGPDKQDSFKDLGKKEGKQVPALAVHKGKAEEHNCLAQGADHALTGFSAAIRVR